jgi:hypothetical protein
VAGSFGTLCALVRRDDLGFSIAIRDPTGKDADERTAYCLLLAG